MDPRRLLALPIIAGWVFALVPMLLHAALQDPDPDDRDAWVRT